MEYRGLNLPILEARLDWLTCTAKIGYRADDLLGLAEQKVLDEHAAGDKIEDYSFQGYRGLRAGNVSWGWGKLGALVVATQEMAQELGPAMALMADHWSRVDYCCTTLDTSDEVHPDVDYWDAWLRRHRNGRGPISLHRHQKTDGGATLGMGSRVSARYLRIYDKHAESKGAYPAGAWRWELELKREQSEYAQLTWREKPMDSARILASIGSYLEDYKLGVPFAYNTVVEPVGRIARIRDADRLLHWFEVQVAPSVAFVAQARGRDAVLKALNI